MELAGYFPYLPKDQYRNMSEEERFEHQLTLYQESEKIKKKFTSLVFNLQEDLEKNSKLDKVITLLIYYEESLEAELRDCKSVVMVFQRIRKYVSFFDYELIKILAKHLGSSKLNKRLSKYKAHFQEFAKRHICECPSDQFTDLECEEAESKPEKFYIIKMEDETMDKLTVKQLKNFQCKLNKTLGQKFLKIVKVEDGCVQVTFKTFSSSDFAVSDEQQRALSSLGVITISCGSESVHIRTVSSPENKAASGKEKIHFFAMIIFIIITCRSKQ